MDKSDNSYKIILKTKKHLFCFIKMNDGEMNALINPNAGLSRGLDKSSELNVTKNLKEALTYEQENY